MSRPHSVTTVSPGLLVAVLSLLFAGFISGQAHASLTGPLFPEPSFDTGSNPTSVAVGDFNADGKLDMATANYGSNTVSVLLGNGNGTFATKADYPTGSYPCSVAIGDFNADGKPDLTTANYGSNTVSVLLGNGNGTFAAKTDYGTGSTPQSVAIGDLNADGKPDLVTANLLSNTASVLLGNGDGTFAVKTDYETGSVSGQSPESSDGLAFLRAGRSPSGADLSRIVPSRVAA